jgi:cell wall-associated NlpC family hydrolase
MSGGVDQATAAFAAAPDPQAFLDQASTIGYFAQQDSNRIRELATATDAADRATKAKDAKVNEVQGLTDQIGAKKRRIESLLAKNKDKLVAAVKAERAEEAKRRAAAAARERAAQDATPSTAPSTGGSGGASAKALAAVAAAKSKLGAPYVWGGDGPNSFDCSGLTMWAYKQVGIGLPHFTGAQWNVGRHVSRSALRPGDLVFFHSDLHHMGMYVGGGNMIHAPHTGDVVRIAPLAGRPYAGAVRVA